MDKSIACQIREKLAEGVRSKVLELSDEQWNSCKRQQETFADDEELRRWLEKRHVHPNGPKGIKEAIRKLLDHVLYHSGYYDKYRTCETQPLPRSDRHGPGRFGGPRHRSR
jgi:hypothetical protein